MLGWWKKAKDANYGEEATSVFARLARGLMRLIRPRASRMMFSSSPLQRPQSATHRKEAAMEIRGLGSAGSSLPVSPLQPARASALEGPAQTLRGSDQVEISDMGRILDEISRLPDIRHQKVAEIRQAIASGVYETADKIDTAVERLLEELRTAQLT